MRFLVFGAGALGSLVGARLASAHEVALIGRPDHVDAVRRHGLRVSGKNEVLQTDLAAAASVGELGAWTPDAILVTVKAYDTEGAMAALESFYGASTFVSLQNGLGNEEIMARSAARVIGAVINQGATLVGPGEIFHAGGGETTLGPFEGTTVRDAEPIAAAFEESGLPARVTPDIRRAIWGKAALNAAINPISALLGKRTGELIDDGGLAATMKLVVEESTAIAVACGVALDAAEILDKVHAVAEATRDNKSSMLQDLERGRRTEIDAINGALVERAETRGIPAPLNTLLTHMVRAASVGGRP